MTSPAAPAPAQPAEVAEISYSLTAFPIQQLLDEIYAPLVGRTQLRAPPSTTADARDHQPPVIAPDGQVRVVPSTTTKPIDPDLVITLKTEHPLTKSEAIRALEDAMANKGLIIVPVGEKYFKVVTGATGPAALGGDSLNAAGPLPKEGNFITKIVPLKGGNPDGVVKALGSLARSPNSVIYIPSTQSLVLRGYTENVSRMLELVEILDVDPAQTIKSEVIPIQGLPANDIAARIPHLAQTRIIVDERTNSLLVFASDVDMKMIQQIILQDENPKDIR
jgi:type II secretory pathway component GspD/PulD (secretin)